MSFKRARSEEQREIRRRAILDTAAAMLDEMPVADVSLNELSRRVGLAKSNVLRYFESREAILLELLTRAGAEWLAELDALLADDPGGTVRERGDRLAATVARSLASHRMLCDLLSAQAAVLERNVSTEVVTRYKRTAHDAFDVMTAVLLRHVPELGENAWKVCAMAGVYAGGLWTHAHPSASVLAAYEADPSLAALRLDFAADLEETLATLISGIVARG